MSSLLTGHDDEDEDFDGGILNMDGSSPIGELSRLTPDSKSGNNGQRRINNRNRGKPRGSRTRTPGVRLSGQGTAAAESAGAQAGKVAALAACSTISTPSGSVVTNTARRGQRGASSFRGSFSGRGSLVTSFPKFEQSPSSDRGAQQ